ncbi:MAG: GTPase [Ruminococcaceae bacterium]|nr:GTPase [Oscillospiraceae bacterium]
METAVYLFTGFLESGKTKLIQESLADKNFNSGEENTLIILCEEGIEEIDPFACPNDGKNLFIEVIERIEQINPDKLSALQKKHSARRIIIEYNGMWKIDDFYNAMPKDWIVYQEIMLADTTTFLNYNANMRSLVVDKLQGCEMVIFNRFSDKYEKIDYHKIARAVSRNVNIAYEYSDGNVEFDDIEDPLPFDINSPVIEIKDEDYAIWYRDLVEDFKKYEGKTVKFKGIIAKDERMDANSFVIGRHVMVCCADDISYRGLVCNCKGASKYKTKDWAIVKAKILIKKHKLYGSEGPVLDSVEIADATPPLQEVATF